VAGSIRENDEFGQTDKMKRDDARSVVIVRQKRHFEGYDRTTVFYQKQ